MSEPQDLSEQRAKAAECMLQWVQFWVQDIPAPEVLKENVSALFVRLQCFNTLLPDP